jgi:hypothetical protein
MLHHILELCLQLFSRLWPLILAVVILVPLIGLMALGIYLKRKMKSAKLAPDKTDRRAPKRGVMTSLHRLPKDKYQLLSLVHIPRLNGKRSTHLHHVVLSNFGIFVIQPQEQCGHISGAVDEPNWTVDGEEGLVSFINPIIRNDYHVKALAQFLGLPEALFFSIIFFQREVSFDQSPPPNVLSKRLGRHILSHTTPIISPEVISQALTALRPMTSAHDYAHIIHQKQANEEADDHHISPTAFSSAPGNTRSTSVAPKQPRSTSAKTAR